jgi:hypothetical protein
LANDEWILLGRQVHPLIHKVIMDTAQAEAIAPKDAHQIIAAE